ncbi:tripartite tricarboxylate transporter TctB family protein [Thermodesulfobacteriota bacterium]
MRYSGKAFMSFFMVMIAAGVFFNAIKWPLRAGLFPIIVSIPFFFTAMIQLFLNLFRREQVDRKGVAFDLALSENIDRSTANRRTLETFVAIIAFFLMILLLGFNIAVPLFIFSYLKFYSREKWSISLILTILTWFFFFGLFILVLHTIFPEGLVLKGLRALWTR